MQRKTKRFANRRRMRPEELEGRLFLTAVGFQVHEIVRTFDGDIQPVHVVDADNDGDLDVITGSHHSGYLSLHENLDNGNFAKGTIFWDGENQFGQPVVADIDTDGDFDVLSYSVFGGVSWYRNNGVPQFEFVQQLTSHNTFAHFVSVIDFDGDEDLDVVVRRPRATGFTWFENTDGDGNFELRDGDSFLSETNLTYAGDLDRDGDLDFIGSNVDGHFLFEKLDDQGTHSAQRLSTPDGAFEAHQAYMADVDGDGDRDLMVASYEGTHWLEYQDGSFSIDHPVDASRLYHAEFEDIDRDGDVDVAIARYDREGVSWLENSDGQGGSWVDHPVQGLDDSMAGVSLADIDGDGDLDLIGSTNELRSERWYENTDGLGTYVERSRFERARPSWLSAVAATDFDGDSDPDLIVLSSDRRIGWYENSDGQGTLSEYSFIAETSPLPRTLKIADLDGDGDDDLLYITEPTRSSDGLVWRANRGDGTYDDEQVIVTGSLGNRILFRDMDADGVSDLVVLVYGGVQWFEFRSDTQRFELAGRLVTNRSVSIFDVGDIDGDGDLDVVTASGCNEIAWFQQLSIGVFASKKIVAERCASDLALVDMTGDGLPEVFSTAPFFKRLAWNENLGAGQFGVFELIQTGSSYGDFLPIQDIDCDQDMDIVLSYGWLENTGPGQFGLFHPFVFAPGLMSTDVVDLDGDGDLDRVGITSMNALLWMESRTMGDVNGDGVFNSSDLVAVFQAGEYEDLIRTNSAFDEGDWNGDGEFTTADLVTAFQVGTFVAASVPRTAIRPHANLLASAVDDFWQNGELAE